MGGLSMKAMKRLDIIIRPEKLEKLKEILEKKDYSGMTVFTAIGCGYQEGFIPEFEEMNFEINLLPKVVVMVVVWEEDVEDLLGAIHEELATGQVGDGRVFISPVDDVMRIRTGERGAETL